MKLPLAAERRWMRVFRDAERKVEWSVSRFMDDSASITLEELRNGWNRWPEYDRQDLCEGASWLSGHVEFSAMLRFVLEEATPRELSCIASCAAAHLPRDEVFEFFLRTLGSTSIGEASNFVQALAITKHPWAIGAIRDRLELVWAHPGLWQDDLFSNRVAFEATVCIEYLLKLGSDPRVLEEQVRALSEHVCSGNRRTCINYFGQYYSWLTEPEHRGG